jgi:putative transposase
VIAKDLKPACTAASEAEALDRFAEFSGKWEKRYPAIIRLWENAWAGSSGALPRRSPLRTGRASCPRIRLKQALRCRVAVQSCRVCARCAVRLGGRNGCGQGVKRWDHPAVRGAGQR